MEICVRKGTKSSSSSSASSSRQDLSIQDNVSRSSSSNNNKTYSVNQPLLVSVNHSNVFQLMKVKGISQTLAENVVMHREKKGLFRSVDDLLKVKGLKPYLLSAVRQHLTVEEVPVSASSDTSRLDGSNGSSHSRHKRSQSSGNYSTSNLIDAQVNNSDSQEDMISLYGPLTKKSFRGVRKKQYYTKRNNRPVMRIGSWNLQQCAEEKTNNPGVKEVVAMTVLENG